MGDKMRRMCGECVYFEEGMERSCDGLSYMGNCMKDSERKESLSWCSFAYTYSPNMAAKQYAKRMKRLGISAPEEWVEGQGVKKKICHYCHALFTPERPNEKYCGEECRHKVTRARNDASAKRCYARKKLAKAGSKEGNT